MKFSTITGALTLALGLAQARMSETEAAAVCGELGVIDTSQIPKEINPESVRTCLEHPEGRPELPFAKRECISLKKLWGCSKNGYCWQSCIENKPPPPKGQSRWCWATVGSPFGPWKRCSKDSDCGKGDDCARGYLQVVRLRMLKRYCKPFKKIAHVRELDRRINE